MTELRLRWYWALCLDCAHSVYAVQPTEQYAHRVARLLFGTGAHESQMYTHTRQIGFPFTSERGAFGLWQCESISIKESMRRLNDNAAVRHRVAEWVFQHPGANPHWYTEYDLPTLMRLIAACDRMACAFARLHYLWDVRSVPESATAQAIYWGSAYNTRNEPAKNAAWLAAYERAYSLIDTTDAAVVA